MAPKIRGKAKVTSSPKTGFLGGPNQVFNSWCVDPAGNDESLRAVEQVMDVLLEQGFTLEGFKEGFLLIPTSQEWFEKGVYR